MTGTRGGAPDGSGKGAPRLHNGVIRRGSTWSYVIRVTNGSGVSKPRWVGGFPTEAAAKRARDLARAASARGELVDRSTLTVEQYLHRWLEGHAVEVKPRTRAGYAHLIEVYVAPRIGARRLQDLRPADLSGLYRDLLAGGGRGGRALSGRTVEYVHAVLHKAFADAVRTDQLLTSNPAERAKRPRKPPAEPVVLWSATDLSAFLDVTRSHRLHAFFRLAAYTGARRGELMNLRWPDVHLGEPGCDDDGKGVGAFLRLRGTVSVIDGVRVEGTTKGGRERTVSIDPGTATVLVEHQRRQEAERDVAGACWAGPGVQDGHVFRRELGDPLFPDTPTALMARLQRQHNDVLQAAGKPLLPVIRLHDLRHLHATLLLKAGVPVHVVAARLGHTDPAVTLRVYAHVLDDQASGAAITFEQLINNTPAGQPTDD
ncbi:Integrase family protein [Nostocoides japonicum T1-X7]|uniref:Integrase family protein n=1 Tax=Nostocoides japonicum T1-X7 TaxID=1194083 RepID=A0A077LVA9_9MICO|nr:Integrase family protein [Tetrasphaera japonica T1-X7]